jgi:enamine deaminase RidA (YjgF/YER057c/UK114 family)
MGKRINYASDSKWEDIVGYSRAVKIGNLIEVAGTTAVEHGEIIGKDNPYEQSVFIFKKIEKTLLDLGAKMSDVVRTRTYTTDISKWQQIGKAHSEFFKNIKPAATMVEVKSLIDKDLLVEIEVTAVIQ